MGMLMVKSEERGFSYANLAKARELSGKTQEMVASEIGIPQNQYSRYELGKNEPKSALVKKLAEVLGVTTDYLLGRTDSPILRFEDLSPEEQRLVMAHRIAGQQMKGKD